MPWRMIVFGLLVSVSVRAQKEAALGAKLAEEVRRSTTPVESAAVQSYVERLGAELAARFPDSNLSFQFTVVTDALGREPMTLPGGYIFVSAESIAAAHDEASFARTLAHAMAHIANRDAMRMAARGNVVNYGSVPLVFIGGWSGGNGGDTALPRALVETQRALEREADQLAAQVMAGYVPAADSDDGFQRVREELLKTSPVRPRNVPTLRRQ